MGLARGAYVDLCFVIAWGSRYNVSIEDMRSLPSLPASQPGGCDSETGQWQICIRPMEQETRLLAAAMPRPDRAGLSSTRRVVSIDAESHTRGWDGSSAAQCEFAQPRHKADGGACFVEGGR